MTALSTRTGVPFKGSRQLGARCRCSKWRCRPRARSSQQTLELLRADPDVEFAEPDQRRFPHAIPNDTLFPGQWYLQKAATTPSAVDAVGAWDLTTGSLGVVVADLDTGVRYDHPDLLPATSGGRLLPGFDFISDRDNANDGDGWDADPSDPGDWVTAAESALGPLSGCPVGNSSVARHARRRNHRRADEQRPGRVRSGAGAAGYCLRALCGKCGGFDSDIIAAMLWSGGVAVSGAPANPYPAKIINMSLGGKGTCSQSYSNAVSQLTARGVLVVASVGNEGGPVVAPANCPGVVGVGGLRHAGTKVGFSNLGPGTAISAPGGNCVNTGAGEPCIYSIDTTTNLGTQSPTGKRLYRSDPVQRRHEFLGADRFGNRRADGGRQRPTESCATDRPPAGGCDAPISASTDPYDTDLSRPYRSNDLQTSECVCTTATCGAGMANALGAVACGVASGRGRVVAGDGVGGAERGPPWQRKRSSVQPAGDELRVDRSSTPVRRRRASSAGRPTPRS